MARNLLPLLLLLLLAHTLTTTAESNFISSERPPLFSERLVKLHFFWHNRFAPPNQTAVRVAQSPTTNSSPTLFGLMNVIDNPLTTRPQLSSRLVGKCQGTYISVDQKSPTPLMVMTLLFSVEEIKGSTLSVLGRNEESLEVRELPIVGGTGLFRFARGFCKLSTYSITTTTAIVEYNCYVIYNTPYLISGENISDI